MSKANNKKKKSKKKIIAIAVVVLVIGLCIVNSLMKPKKKAVEEDLGIDVQELHKHDLSKSFGVTGTVESQNVLTVSTDITYKIKELNVSLGDYVNEGDVLCSFDDKELNDLIAELELQVSEAEKLSAKNTEITKRALDDAINNKTTEVNNATNAYNTLVDEYNKINNTYNALADKNTPEAVEMAASVKEAEKAMNDAKTNIDTVTKACDDAITTAQDAVDIDAINTDGNSDTTKELAKLYRQRDEMTVTAEQSGIITKLNVSQGSIPNGVLMQIEDNKNLKVKVNIKEKEILDVKNGLQATITADALPDKVYNGTVNKVINFAASSDDVIMDESGSSANANYSAEVIINDENELLLGMNAKVDILIEEKADILSVPVDSIVEEDGEKFVYRAVKQNNDEYKLEKVLVETGSDDGYYVEIKSDELKEKDLIVDYGYDVSEGDVVAVNIHEGI
ncbi:HlyD family secretion protein [Lachnospiraceae bacterium RM5]|nr:HlyD family secretion protein [Lachnospiraceae bacterium RM5]